MRNKVKHLIRYGLYVALVCAVVPVFAADNSCENEDSMINPVLALCSTHAYNVGATENLADGGDKEMMKDVIALKTTIMTQQMYKQYDYLESMIKRFKTQLEKAVLTTKLQASGASSDSSSTSGGGSYKSTDKYAILDGAKNCYLESGTSAVYECLQNNILLSLNAVNSGKTSEAQRQMGKDIEIAVTYGVNKPSDCNYLGNQNYVTQCAYKLRQAITSKMDDLNKGQRGMMNQQQRMFGDM